MDHRRKGSGGDLSVGVRLLKGLDLYQKVPKDLTEATSSGAIFSILSALFMVILFHIELYAFLVSSIETFVVVDDIRAGKLPIAFNITMLDLACDYVSIDVTDVLGTNRANVSQNIHKWHLDKDGLERAYHGKNTIQRDIIMFDERHVDLEALHENGVHAVPLDAKTFDIWLEEHEWVVVNFFAPWCMWCQRLAPTWEAFAEATEAARTPATIVAVDCVANTDICRRHNIQAFPSLFLFHKGQMLIEYKEDRTVQALAIWLQKRLSEFGDAVGPNPTTADLQQVLTQEEQKYPGCSIVGRLEVNRVPGNFHIEARSKAHSFNPYTTNLSHIINDLQFGMPPVGNVLRKMRDVAEDLKQLTPLNDMGFVTTAVHDAPHHYIKVVPTRYELRANSKRGIYEGYQMIAVSQTMHYEPMVVPEARFSYNLSPMTLLVKRKSRPWYTFMTAMLALVGGTFSMLKLADTLFYKVASKHHRRKGSQLS